MMDTPFIWADEPSYVQTWSLDADGTRYTVRVFDLGEDGVLVAAEPLGGHIQRGWFIVSGHAHAGEISLTQDYVAEKLGLRLDHIDTWNLTRLIGAALGRDITLRETPIGREV